jgi:uncharacterized protein
MKKPNEQGSSVSETRKRLWVAAGWISFALGVIGVVLPVMPTAPFMIVAAFCFSRGSERWHRWLTSHPKFGAPILDWERHGVIRLKSKIISTFLIGGSVVSTFFVFPVPEWARIGLAIIFPLVLLFIWTRPSKPRQA